MQLLLFFFSFASLILPGKKKADVEKYRSYPKLENVSKEFDRRLNVIEDDRTYLALAKKPEGWVILRRQESDDKIVDEDLFWSAKTKSYRSQKQMTLNYPGVNPENRFVTMTRSHYPDAYFFERQVYCGYPGWQDDVISDLDGAVNLNDTLLESLARACSKKCNILTRGEDYNKPDRSMDDKAAAEFCRWGDKGLDAYRRILSHNPGYETFVGKITTKYSNEYMFLWSELHVKNRPEAKKYLAPGLYDPLLLNFAFNLLNGADSNAIIFTNGDNDTYPLWYAQQQLHVRPDVAVINLSLIYYPDWLFTAKEDHGFRLLFSESLYRDTLTDLILIRDRPDLPPMAFSAIPGMIARQDPLLSYPHTGENNYLRFIERVRLGDDPADTLAPLVTLGAEYIYKNDLAVLDIITANLGTRPVYFTNTIGEGTVLHGLRANLVSEGLLRRVIPAANTGTNIAGELFNADKMYKNMTGKFRYGLEPGMRVESPMLVTNYAYTFYLATQALLHAGDTTAALRTLACWETSIPSSLYDDARNFYLLGSMYQEAGQREKSRELFLFCIEKIRNDKDPENAELNETILSLLSLEGNEKMHPDVVKAAGELREKLNRE
jgi:hypothetical protein